MVLGCLMSRTMRVVPDLVAGGPGGVLQSLVSHACFLPLLKSPNRSSAQMDGRRSFASGAPPALQPDAKTGGAPSGHSRMCTSCIGCVILGRPGLLAPTGRRTTDDSGY